MLAAYSPIAQRVQMTLPAAAAEPAGHSAHIDSPAVGANVPAPHGAGSMLPAVHACPIGQVSHSSGAVRPEEFEKVPGGQTRGRLDPSGQ
eukprot:scaffold281636_cov35-Tisochrysis_lutea.AAC.4